MSEKRQFKFTKTSLAALEARDTEFFAWDTELGRFGIRMKPSGHMIYFVQYRINGRQRRRKIGTVGILSPDKARDAARKYLAKVELDSDPAEEKEKIAADITFTQLVARYKEEYASHHLKERTAREYRQLLRQKVVPALGHYRITKIDQGKVALLKSQMSDTPAHANHALAVTSSVLSYAVSLGLIPHNPVYGVKRFPSPGRDRYLTDVELAKLGASIRNLQADGTITETATNCIIFTALTGLRIGEARGVRWKDLDLEYERISLPQTKTGPRTAALSPETISFLNGLDQLSDFVFTSDNLNAPIAYSVVRRSWETATKFAKLENVCIHDLRHTVATYMAQSGNTPFELMAHLGWTTLAMAQRYVSREAVGKRHPLPATTRIHNALFGTNVVSLQQSKGANTNVS